MRYVLDGIYLFCLIVLSPFLIFKALTTGKYRRGLWDRALGRTGSGFPRNGKRDRVWFHGVSVGEIHLLRTVIAAFRTRYPNCECVVSTTTDTGFDEARKWFSELTVIRWPLDFSWAVERALDEVRPAVVVLAESELWPNFLLAAKRWAVPVVAINVRMSPRSFRRWERIRSISRRLFDLVSHFAVQTPEYADRLRSLGVAAERISVTGSVKYDGAESDRRNPRTAGLAELLNIHADHLVWVVGSTQAPEEEVALSIFLRLRTDYPNLRLILVPRQRERFAEVAGILERAAVPFVRRSEITAPLVGYHEVILVDTFGELGALWGLADLAFVGGSLDGKRGGQNMIEPAAYGATVIFGPYVWNFRDTVQRLLEADAAVQVQDAEELAVAVRTLLADGERRTCLGAAARALVRSQQGAAARTIAALGPFVIQPPIAKTG